MFTDNQFLNTLTVVALAALLLVGGVLVVLAATTSNNPDMVAAPMTVEPLIGDVWDPHSGEPDPNYKPRRKVYYSKPRSVGYQPQQRYRNLSRSDQRALVGSCLALTEYEQRVRRRATDSEARLIVGLMQQELAGSD